MAVIIPLFEMEELARFLAKKHEELEGKALQILRYVGEKFVRDARKMTKSMGGFGDVTGNLRSSIGYVIFKDGVPIQYNFRTFRTGKGAVIGKEVGSQFAETIKGSGSGFQLVGVAGMKYAKFVENKGFNVISYQADAALVDLSEMVRKLRIK